MKDKIMHVGFITSEYPNNIFNTSFGGIATFTKNLAELLINYNHKVSIFIHSQKENTFLIKNGIHIHYIKKRQFRGFTWLANRISFNKYINKQVIKYNIDILEAPEWTGFTAFMKFKCPLIIRLHGSDTYFCHLEKRKVKTKNKFFEKIALKGASEIVGVSNFVSEKTKKLFKLVKRDFKVIHNTVDFEKLKPDHSEIKYKTLLYFGAIIRKKGVFQIIDTFNKVIDIDDTVQLKMIGRDCIDFQEKQSTLLLLKKRLNNKAFSNFFYEPSLPHKEILKEIKKAHIVLLPSLAEAFPMTWLEAMALEKRLITSNIGWAKELMIDGKTGYMINPNDSNEFSKKIESLLKVNEENSVMAINARKQIINNFSIEKFASQNIELYKSVLQNEI